MFDYLKNLALIVGLILLSYATEAFIPTKNRIEALGFNAENHIVTTKDGYNLTLTRVLSPYVNGGKSGLKGRRPILLVHGEYTESSCFIARLDDKTRPKDFTFWDIESQGLERTIERFKHEPVAKSIALLGPCFGQEVWMLNRRGGPESLDHVKYKSYHDVDKARESIGSLPPNGEICSQYWDLEDPMERLKEELVSFKRSIDPRYWNYTLDHVVRFDLPGAMDYILDFTNQNRLAVIGHSTGAATIIMLLSSIPEYNDKISSAIFWSPSIYQRGAAGAQKRVTLSISEALENYVGPYFQSMFSHEIQCLIYRICSDAFGMKSCGFEWDNNYSEDELLIYEKHVPVSSHQVIHIHQAVRMGKMYHYNYEDPELNYKHYGSPKPPLYNVSTIDPLKVSIFRGDQDDIASPPNVKRLIEDLRFPVKDYYYTKAQGHRFVHWTPLIGDERSSMVVIPSLFDIRASDSLA